MEQDPVLQLVDTALSFETMYFLRDLVFLAMISPNYMSCLRRIMVSSLTIFKDPHPPRHEGTVVELIDTDRPQADHIITFLERTASANRPSPQDFFGHPSGGAVFRSIIQSLKDIVPSTLASLTTSGSNDSSSGPLIPLLNLTHPPSPPYHPIIDEPESDHEPEPECNRLPWFDATTLAGTKVLHASTQLSSNIVYRVDDRFVGSHKVAVYVPSLHNLRQIRLEPGTLSLFDLAVLTDCVHNHSPLYSLLEHHCYWFVQIMCAIIEKLYPCTTVHSNQYAPVSEDTIRIPTNDYLPDLAGRTMGVLVCKVEEEVVSLVASEFKAYKEAKLDKIKARWEIYHQPEELRIKENAALREKVSHLENIIRAHNLDPNVNVDSQQHD